MSLDAVCLRPKVDFTRVGVTPPEDLSIDYRAPDDPALPGILREARALVIPAVGPKLAPELFEGAGIRLVQVTGAGVDRLDQPALVARGIPVANVPGGSNGALAEYAVTSAATLLRRLAWSTLEIRRGNYAPFRARMLADNVGGLEGCLVGLIGYGVIGRAVAAGFLAAGADVAFYDPAFPPGGDPGVAARPMGFEEILAKADVVSLHVPLIPATQGLIGADALARMKPGVILINAARGGIVDEAALVQALASGHVGGAAVDVYSTEPPGADNPLLQVAGEAADRLLLTPHIAGVTRQSAQYLFRAAWDNVQRVVKRGELPANRVY
ncbi:NAD(P)-dependent oxidoreductase [Ancylobacter terrae]|uniref:NAD(P)-dependent oxidoreductase n=1 Tax=Ancylobacter sp. sgz301288 TaxID=3342077 RepID=UPI00385CFE2E